MKKLLSFRGNHKAQTGFMSVAFLFPFILSAAFFVGCNKEMPLSVNQPAQEGQKETVKTVNLEAAKFAYQGKLHEREEFEKLFKEQEFPVMVTGTGLSEENVVYVFDSEANFNTWANTTPFSEKLTKVSKLALEAKQKADVNSTLSVKGTMTPGGRLYLFEHIGAAGLVSGPYPVTSIFWSLGAFNKLASSGWLFNPPNLFPAYTICALYTSTSWGGSQIIFVNSSLNTTLKFELTKYLFWNDQTQSLIVI